MRKGIGETKQLLGFIISLANAIGNSLEDGKIGISDLMHFLDSVRLAAGALTGIAEVPAELTDLDDKEKQELINYCMNKFDIPQDKVESRIESALVGGLAIIGIVKDFMGEDK